jgi:geranylgeranyl diphosphate synthase, type II
MLDFETARQIIEEELEGIKLNHSPDELYDPVRYILSIGGKRMRPALTLMACSLFNEVFHPALKPALAIEVFHNFTLLHDDIMDNSSMRRGQATVHIKWNTNTAILSGDVMSILSFQILSETDEDHLKELMQLFTRTATEVCEGQQLDMNFESISKVSTIDYMEMIRLKTAVLVACSLKAGAISGGADTLEADLLYEFGRNLGMAFQLRDDFLDVFGDQEKFGKKIGNDIVTGKKTFLLIKALEIADGDERKKLIKLINDRDINPSVKILATKQIYEDLKLDEITNGIMNSYYLKSLQYLDRVKVPDERKTHLADFANTMMDREQ